MRAALIAVGMWWVPLAVHAECPEGDLALEAVESVVDDELDRAVRVVEEGLSAAGCGLQPMQARQWATLWQVRAAVHYFQGDSAQLEGALAQAVAVSPDWFEERLGAGLKEEWARSDLRGGASAQVRVQPFVDGAVLFVDGRPVRRGAAKVIGGEHLVQVAVEQQVLFTRVLEIREGEKAVLDAGLKRSVRPSTPLGWCSVGSGSLAVLTWGGAIAFDRRSMQATSLAEHDAPYARSRALAGTALGLGTTSVVLWGIERIRR